MILFSYRRRLSGDPAQAGSLIPIAQRRGFRFLDSLTGEMPDFPFTGSGYSDPRKKAPGARTTCQDWKGGVGV